MIGNLVIRPLSANLEHSTDFLMKMDPYLKVIIGDAVQCSTCAKNFHKHPHWAGEMAFTCSSNEIINFEIWDKNSIGRDKLICSASFPLTSLMDNFFFDWIPCYYKGKPAGNLLIDVHFTPGQMGSSQMMPQAMSQGMMSQGLMMTHPMSHGMMMPPGMMSTTDHGMMGHSMTNMMTPPTWPTLKPTMGSTTMSPTMMGTTTMSQPMMSMGQPMMSQGMSRGQTWMGKQMSGPTMGTQTLMGSHGMSTPSMSTMGMTPSMAPSMTPSMQDRGGMMDRSMIMGKPFMGQQSGGTQMMDQPSLSSMPIMTSMSQPMMSTTSMAQPSMGMGGKSTTTPNMMPTGPMDQTSMSPSMLNKPLATNWITDKQGQSSITMSPPSSMPMGTQGMMGPDMMQDWNLPITTSQPIMGKEFMDPMSKKMTSTMSMMNDSGRMTMMPMGSQGGMPMGMTSTMATQHVW